MKTLNKDNFWLLDNFGVPIFFSFPAGFLILLMWAGVSLAAPDYYIGDAAIYGGGVTGPHPNVLFVIDNSAGMRQSGVSEAYVPTKDYSEYGDNTKDAVYVRKAATAGTINYGEYISSVGSVTCSDALAALVGDEENPGPGAYYGPLKKSDGSCNASQSGNYYTGNFLNYLLMPADTEFGWQKETAYEVGDKIQEEVSDGTYIYICKQAGISGSEEPLWSTDLSESVEDGTVVWVLSPDSLIDMVETTVAQVAEAAKDSINVGFMVFGDNNHGAKVVQPVQDISAGTTTFTNSVYDISDGLLPSNLQPVNESLWDAGLYYRGDNDSTSKISSDNIAYPSPAEYWCQKNFVIVVTTGNSPDTVHTKHYLTDLNEDSTIGDAADAAVYNLTQDTSVQTKVIQLMSVEVPILKEAAEKGHEEGTDDVNNGYYNVWDTTELTEALHDAIANILVEVDTSFVAPVVPASPENRTYSGQRIYLGFFKPMNDEPWYGNLKKFGLNYDNQITAFDGTGDLVPTTDFDGYFLTDTDGVPKHYSFWTPSGTDDPTDGGLVDVGGVGGLLKTRDKDSNPRKIYTYLGSESDLTNSANAFTTSNTPLKDSLTGDNDTEKNEVINFIRGFEADGATKRTWLLGDILHSKPLIINYANYVFSETNEEDGTKNKSMIFFGANDGMLHAIYDHNGEEAWAFIPPELLDDLDYIMSAGNHYYYVDASPLAYVHDADGDGDIESGDKVILIFGLRRGGGSSTLTSGSRGSYYALDITDPAKPLYLWSIDNQTTGFEELGQTWSQPRLAKMKIREDGSDKVKVVAVFGAGYDNNEDLRFGNTQTFPSGTDATTITSAAASGFESGVSSNGGVQYLARGRGIYVAEVADLGTVGADSYSPTIATSPKLIWSVTVAHGEGETSADGTVTDSAMTFSIPSDVLVYDQDHDSYADRFYAADTGGQLWRCNVDNTSVDSWSVKKIFESNSGSSDVGRKVFYKPTITYKYPDTFIYFGTGDREHPLNYLTPGTSGGAVLDRFYMVRDRESDDNPDAPTFLTESNLVDVTQNDLQRDDGTAKVDTLLDQLYNYSPIDDDGSDRDVYYGWRIDLDANAGEKVLAPPTVFADVVFFTTYTPTPATEADDPCASDNLGDSRLYAVNSRTGEAVYNWWSEDGADEFGENQSSSTSKRAQGGADDNSYVLRRADRSLTIGKGIPSGLVVVIGKDGSTSILVGSGGAFPNVDLSQIETVYPLYWMTW